MKFCAVCGADWDECGGECADWITKEEKVAYLKMLELNQKEEDDNGRK